MKKLQLLLVLVLMTQTVFAQIAWVEVHGDTQFCPGETRESTYSINDNFNMITYWKIDCNRCVMRVDSSDPWVSSLTAVSRPSFGDFQVKWDEGNFDDAWIRYRAKGNWTWFAADKTDIEYVKLVENDEGSSWPPNPNVDPIISSSLSSISCGSTSSITFTANWKNANSYSWTPINGTITGSTTGSTITMIPNPGTSSFVEAKVRGYNNACGVYSTEVEKG
ncbi:MAG: hypothetical protein HC819_19930 [Cyclobacteriaceae bacterium]|nr:hypothetical protein [Cyclobacteriaceae bacterium]